MNINAAYPSTTLKATELGDDDVTYTIERVEVETLGQGKDAEQKPVVYFRETEKGLVLNKTNANTVSGLYGPETDDWTGKRITLYATEVEFQGKMQLGIRVRLRKPGGGSAPSSAPTSAPASPAPKNKTQEAWEVFQAKTAGLSKPEQAAKWKAAIGEIYPGRRSDQITDEEWDFAITQFNTVLMENGELLPM